MRAGALANAMKPYAPGCEGDSARFPGKRSYMLLWFMRPGVCPRRKNMISGSSVGAKFFAWFTLRNLLCSWPGPGHFFSTAEKLFEELEIDDII